MEEREGDVVIILYYNIKNKRNLKKEFVTKKCNVICFTVIECFKHSPDTNCAYSV